MPDDRTLWLLVPAALRRLPADLATVLAATALTVGVTFAPFLSESPLRLVLGLFLVFFLPGYAVTAALFPATSGTSAKSADSEGGRDFGRGIDGTERFVLSLGLSVAVSPLIGLVLTFTPFGLDVVPVVLSLAAVTTGVTVIAAYRRLVLPPDDRFSVAYREHLAAGRSALFEHDNRRDAVVSGLVIVLVLVATATAGYAIATPVQPEPYSRLYLLTESPSGELLAEDYPTEFTVNEGKPVVLGIENHERRPLTYTVVVELQRVGIEDNETTVRERVELDRLSTRLAHNESWRRSYQLRPTMTGTRLRAAFLLYEASPPADPSLANADESVHLWINVSDS